jgi:predicted SAM-dependent methyltransferase
MDTVFGSALKGTYKYFRQRYKRTLLRRRIANQSPLRVILGAGGLRIDGWVSTDIETLDLLCSGDWHYYFVDAPIDSALSEHVWEHLTWEEGIRAARNCHQYLREGAYLRAAVPDGFHPKPDYLDMVRPGGGGPGATGHKVLYDYRSFQELFRNVGFVVELLEYFDENGEFHFINWDPAEGLIRRSMRFDGRNRGGALDYTSVILDAKKRS